MQDTLGEMGGEGPLITISLVDMYPPFKSSLLRMTDPFSNPSSPQEEGGLEPGVSHIPDEYPVH